MVKQTDDRLLGLLKAKISHVETERANHANHWQEVAKLVNPADKTFIANDNTSYGSVDAELYDSVGRHSNQLLASGFYSLLTSSSSPWFYLTTTDEELNKDEEVQQWFHIISNIMLREIQRPTSNFTSATNEGYVSYGAYGNMVMFITENKKRNGLNFRCLPLAECFFIDDEDGQVTTLIRQYTQTVSQLVSRFGLENLSDKVKSLYEDGKFEDKVNMVHFIFPKSEIRNLKLKSRFPFVSIYFEKSENHIVNMRGYNELPFMAARFYRAPGTVYGYGPGSDTLPDLRMLQEMRKTVIRAAQKVVDPPLGILDNGVIHPDSIALYPGALNWLREQGAIAPIVAGGEIALGEDLAESLKLRIRESFFVDQLQLNQGPQMTATEVQSRVEEKMRLLGPIVGNATTEFLSPLIRRCYGLLAGMGKFPEPPVVLQETSVQFDIVYTSPIAKAQEQITAGNFERALQILTPLFAVDPSSFDNIDADEVIRDTFRLYALPPAYLRDEDELAAQREAQAQAAQQAQEAENLKNTGLGVKALAGAAATGQAGGMF